MKNMISGPRIVVFLMSFLFIVCLIMIIMPIIENKIKGFSLIKFSM